MEYSDVGDVVNTVDQESEYAKHLHSSQGDTPGKPNNKSRRVSCIETATSSRALYASPRTSESNYSILITISIICAYTIC